MSKRHGGFFAGAAIGAVIAGTAALLFAPKAGEELREDIVKKAKEVSQELDRKIAKAKKDAEGMTGDARAKKLQSIQKAEQLKVMLTERRKDFTKSGKKVTRVAARETDKLIQEGRILINQLDEHKSGAVKDTQKFVKKASKSGAKVVRAASKEMNKEFERASTNDAKK